MAQSHLRNVKRTAARLEAARERWVAAILAARDSGESLRDIAAYAGVSYTRIHQLVRDADKDTGS